jgi:hypothetical protein
MKKLRRSKDRKKSTNQEEIGKRLMMFCRRQQDGSVDSVRQDIQLYILQKTIRMHMEAWTLLDGGSRLYALLHEARVRRELIL